MSLTKIGKTPTSINRMEDALKVTAKDYNALVDAFNAAVPALGEANADTINEYTSGEGVTIDGVILKDGAVVSKVTVEEGATRHLTAADSGKVFFLNSDTGIVAWVLPAPSPGLRFKFIFTANKITATSIVTADIADTSGDMFRGGLLICAAAAVNTFVEASGDINTMTFDDDVENGAAGIGSWVEVICTEDPIWFVHGVINSTTDANGVGSAIFSDADA